MELFEDWEGKLREQSSRLFATGYWVYFIQSILGLQSRWESKVFGMPSRLLVCCSTFCSL